MRSTLVGWISLRRFLVMVSLAFTLFGGAVPVHADLIFERVQGGPNQYNGTGGFQEFRHVAYFEVAEPLRITGVTGWISGLGRVGIALSGGVGHSYGAGFDETVGPPYDPTVPAQWRGVSSLQWDLVPGEYAITFHNAYMPFSYGGPESTARPFTRFEQYLGDELWALDPFGVRIYGTFNPVPEPATYGLMGSLSLLALAAMRRRAGLVRKPL